jgi:hypothetical protein
LLAGTDILERSLLCRHVVQSAALQGNVRSKAIAKNRYNAWKSHAVVQADTFGSILELKNTLTRYDALSRKERGAAFGPFSYRSEFEPLLDPILDVKVSELITLVQFPSPNNFDIGH